MRIVFLGTPEFAVPSLQALLARHQVVSVFTQPDRPKGRGNKLTASPVKTAAVSAHIPVHQPERIRRAPNPELLASLTPELIVVVGYGQIIPQAIIDLPPRGIVNVHASLLPKYRGAAPIQWAIASGEAATGVTIMQIDAGLDTGDMLLAKSIPIGPSETAPELSVRLASLGADLLLEAIEQLERGSAHPQKQNDGDATLAPILKREDGLIDWARSAVQTYNRLRGFAPWPGAHTTFRGGPLLIVQAHAAGPSELRPGQIKGEKRMLLVGCGGHSSLAVTELQLAGKSRMTAESFLNGYRPQENEHLGGSF